MKHVLLTATLTLAAALAASADATRVWALSVDQPFAHELPPVSENGAAYLTIVNEGGQPDRLVGVSSPAAERAELHMHEHAGAMMRMKQVDGVDLPAGATVRFEPGGLHVMLMGLVRPLQAGESFPLTLRFRDAGDVEVAVPVLARGERSGAHGMHGGHGTTKKE